MWRTKQLMRHVRHTTSALERCYGRRDGRTANAAPEADSKRASSEGDGTHKMKRHKKVCSQERQANWHMTEGGSPLKRRNNRTTFLREPCAVPVRGRRSVGSGACGRTMERRKVHCLERRGSLLAEGNTGRVVMVRPDRALRRLRTQARTYVICWDLGDLRVIPAQGWGSHREGERP